MRYVRQHHAAHRQRLLQRFAHGNRLGLALAQKVATALFDGSGFAVRVELGC